MTTTSGVLGPVLLARTLAVQWAVGGALALLLVVLPRGTERGTGVLLLLGVLAVALGPGTWWVSRRPGLRMREVHLAIGAAPLMVGLAVEASADPHSPLLFFFLWTALYAGVSTVRAGVGHLGWTWVCLAAGMTGVDPARGAEAATSALMVVLTSLVGAALVGQLCRALRQQARHDSLTGLPNRDVFTERAAAATLRWRDRGGSTFVLLIDLDRFKDVNDTYGHHVGDRLLETMVPRLQAAVGEDGLLVRLGGDEFAVLCDDPSGRLTPSEIVAGIGEVWRQPMDLGHGTVYVSGCVGSAEVADRSATPASLLRDADTAMYRAKAGGPGRYLPFRPGMRTDDLRMRRERHLREALGRDELSLVYQPVVDLMTGRAVGVEALLRWSSPDLGEVAPEGFIPLAEETGLIGEIGAWLLDRAVADLATWRADGIVGEDFSVAVNVSARQLQRSFPGLVSLVLDRHGVPPTSLGLEITESTLLSLADTRVLDELHDLGTTLLLDDFGTGWSSLSHLRQFPFDVLKIDRSFVASMHEHQQDRSIVDAVLAMGAALDLVVVAEGVQVLDQAQRLREAGCPRAQGFLFSAGVPAGSLPAVLAALSATPAVPVGPVA